MEGAHIIPGEVSEMNVDKCLILYVFWIMSAGHDQGMEA
jgi:hypothetical protein